MHALLRTPRSSFSRSAAIGMLCVLLIGSRPASAQLAHRFHWFGTLDQSFDAVSGIGTTITTATRDAQDRIIVAGASSTRFVVARLTPGGALDPSFGGDGIVETSFPGTSAQVTAVAVRGSSIVVAGTVWSDGLQKFAAACYTFVGGPCPYWGTLHGGRTVVTLTSNHLSVAAIAVRPDGSFVVAGDVSGGVGVGGPGDPQWFMVAGFSSDGHLDQDFGSSSRGAGGKTLVGPYAGAFLSDVVIDASGTIFAAGALALGYMPSPSDTWHPGPFRFAVVSVGPDGQVNQAFGQDGVVTAFHGCRSRNICVEDSVASALALDAAGRVVVAGAADFVSSSVSRPGPDSAVAYRCDGSGFWVRHPAGEGMGGTRHDAVLEFECHLGDWKSREEAVPGPPHVERRSGYQLRGIRHGRVFCRRRG